MSFGRRRNGFSTQPVQSIEPVVSAKGITAPGRRQSLSVAETCYLAQTTRRKLSSEVSRPDHDLRVLVGHANFLDSLMIELAEANQEQASESIPPVKEVITVSQESRRPQSSSNTVDDKPADDWEVWESDESDSSESDSGDDKSESDGVSGSIQFQPVFKRSDTFAVESREVGEEDEDDYGDLALVRTLSHSPPEMLDSPFT